MCNFFKFSVETKSKKVLSHSYRPLRKDTAQAVCNVITVFFVAFCREVLKCHAFVTFICPLHRFIPLALFSSTFETWAASHTVLCIVTVETKKTWMNLTIIASL